MHHWDIAILALFVSVALYSDLRKRRIPNGLIVLMLATGLLLQYISGETGAVGNALLGLALGAAALLPLHLAGHMGAGDVKLMGASGLFLGAGLTVVALVYTLLFGGIFAAGRFGLQRIRSNVTAVDRNFPYAAAIAAGIVASLAHTF